MHLYPASVKCTQQRLLLGGAMSEVAHEAVASNDGHIPDLPSGVEGVGAHCSSRAEDVEIMSAADLFADTQDFLDEAMPSQDAAEVSVHHGCGAPVDESQEDWVAVVEAMVSESVDVAAPSGESVRTRRRVSGKGGARATRLGNGAVPVSQSGVAVRSSRVIKYRSYDLVRGALRKQYTKECRGKRKRFQSMSVRAVRAAVGTAITKLSGTQQKKLLESFLQEEGAQCSAETKAAVEDWLGVGPARPSAGRVSKSGRNEGSKKAFLSDSWVLLTYNKQSWVFQCAGLGIAGLNLEQAARAVASHAGTMSLLQEMVAGLETIVTEQDVTRWTASIEISPKTLSSGECRLHVHLAMVKIGGLIHAAKCADVALLDSLPVKSVARRQSEDGSASAMNAANACLLYCGVPKRGQALSCLKNP